METKLYINTKNGLSVGQLKELLSILETQLTSDRSEKGNYELDGEYGCYSYSINQHNEIILDNVK